MPTHTDLDLESLLGSAREGLSPTAEDRHRTDVALAAKLGVGAVGGTVAASKFASGKLFFAKLFGTWKLATMAAVVVASTGTVVAVQQHQKSEVAKARAAQTEAARTTQERARSVGAQGSPAEVSGVAAESPPPVMAPAAIAPASLGSPPVPPSKLGAGTNESVPHPANLPATAPAMAEPAAPVATPLATETRLVRGADAALRSGHLAQARALLTEHQTRFPGGILSEERDAELALLDCKAGNGPRTANRFYAAHPNSPLTQKVRAACGE